MRNRKTGLSSAAVVPPYDNFVALRLLLALLVAITHFKVLSGGALLRWLPTSPEFAVDGFFVISGYVILASYERLPQVVPFYLKRVLRMYPLYLAVIMAQAVGMLVWFWPHMGEVASSATRYLCANLLLLNFLQYDIGGLLSHAVNPGINPSLWTLKIEAMFYLLLPLLFLAIRRFGFAALAALYALSVAYTEVLQHSGHGELAKQLPGALRFFVVGMALYLYRAKLAVPSWSALLLCIAGFFALELHGPLPVALAPLLVGPLMIVAATRIRLPQLKTDLSYGIYLIHGPLIQCALLAGVFRDSYAGLAFLLLASAVLAFFAHKVIELPGIALGHRLAATAAQPPQPLWRDEKLPALQA
jgi:peptidoglycan/LPS O-acetylase OafA/YrhL